MTKNKPSNNPYNKYAIVFSIVIEMIVIIGLGVLLGVFLDDKLNLNYPIFTIILSLLSVAISMYILVKQLNRK